MQLEPNTTARHWRLEDRSERDVHFADSSTAPTPRTVPSPASQEHSLAAAAWEFIRLLLILVVFMAAPSSFAGSSGYLTSVGPAPLRFEKSKRSGDEKAIMKPYTPPFLNAHPEPAASETTETTGNAHPPAPVNALPSQPAEPRRPEQPERTENQAGVPARPDQNATPDSGSQAEPESSSPHDQTALAAHDPRAAEPDFEAVPMTPQMLLHFFQKRSADAGETESGVLVPMTFVPPPAPPHHSSKATYRRSFE